MKQLLWNFMKLIWVVVMFMGYWLYYSGSIGAGSATLWVMISSVALAGIYSFLSAYRLGPSRELGEFLHASEISQINPNQWLFAAWLILSLGIAWPAYGFRSPWVIVGPSLLAGALVLVIAGMAVAGRHYHRVRKGKLTLATI